MFQTHQPNLENMKNYLKEESERTTVNGPNWWSIPSGMSSVRILPPWDPSGRVALPVYMHPIEYKDDSMSYTKYNWTCVNKTFNKPCPICEGLQELSAAGVDISNWEANRRQFYLNALVMHDPTFDNKGKGTAPGTHVLMKAPKTFYDWLIGQITNPMIGDITSITNGIDVYITKEGSGLGTSYSMTLSPNGRTAIPQEYLEKIESLYDLDEIFSAGFEKEQIDKLVNHLKRSAGVLSNGIGNTMNQMAGYTQAPQNPMQMTGYPPMSNPGAQPIPNPYVGATPSAPNQFQATNTAMPPWMSQENQLSQAPAPNQFGAPQPVPNPPAPQVAPTQQSNNFPKCFGSYDVGSVTCVVCPHEIECSKSNS